jgi:hypothetical protein
LEAGEKCIRNDKIHDLYPSPNVNSKIKSRKLIWVWYVACLGEKRKEAHTTHKVQEKRKLKGRDH